MLSFKCILSILLTTVLVEVCTLPACSADYNPPIVNRSDFGLNTGWRGFLADGSKVRYDVDWAGWSRTTPGGFVNDYTLTYNGKPTGKLVSLEQGYLAFRPISIKPKWDFIEFALHNTVANRGMIQFRLYYGMGNPEIFWTAARGRHGWFRYDIPLNFTGWKTFRLRRENFRAYGGPIMWLDEQLMGIGVHVTRTPKTATMVNLAAVRLSRSPVSISVKRDLLLTRTDPVTFELTVNNVEATPRGLNVSVSTEEFAYGKTLKPFTYQLSSKKLSVLPKGISTFTLTATPKPSAQPGDAVTYIVTVKNPGNPLAEAVIRLSAVLQLPHPVTLSKDAAKKNGDSSFYPRPKLSDATDVMYWMYRCAIAYNLGNEKAGQELADTFRLMGDPEKGYRALCINDFSALSGQPNSEPPMAKMKTWLNAFHWMPPIAVGQAYDLIYDSKLLSAEDKVRVEDNFLRPLAWEHTNAYLNSCANGGEERVASLLSIGLAIQDTDLIRYAIDGENGWKHHIGHDMLSGVTMEGTLSYMFAITWPVLGMSADMAGYSGIDLFRMKCPVIADRNHTYETDVETPSFNSVWQHDTIAESKTRTYMNSLYSMVDVAYPNWHFPSINDTAEGVFLQTPSILFQNPVCRDEVNAYFKGAETEIPSDSRLMLIKKADDIKRQSVNLSAIGWALMKNNDGNRLNDQYLLMDYGPHGGAHGHKDKLAFTFWRYGKELAPDLPISDLETPEWSGYFGQSAAHNTIIIDESAQLPSTGEKCLTFASSSGIQMTELEAVSAYADKDARVRRIALMTRDYLLIYDRVTSAKPHTIDLLIHGTGKDGQLTTTIPLPDNTRKLGTMDGYQFVDVLREGAANGQWGANWDVGDNVGLRLISLDGAGTKLIAARGPVGYRRGHKPERGKQPEWYGPDELLPDALLISRRTAQPGTTRFINLLEGYQNQSKVVSAVAEGNTITVKLTDGVEEMITLDGGDKAGKPTKCRFVRRENGKITESTVFNGK
jgi:hypothetical protein